MNSPGDGGCMETPDTRGITASRVSCTMTRLQFGKAVRDWRGVPGPRFEKET